jgi:D-alanyl-D-alanine carboxypeptidase/D-alanyl-D-alanine-endopeptidase (penicillin-binding protein 4)
LRAQFKRAGRDDALKRLIFLIAAATFAPTALAAAPVAPDDELPPSVSAALQRAQIPESAVAVLIQRVGAGERPLPSDARTIPGATTRDVPVLLALHANRAMNPASTMKLVTTYAALELLGPAFTWKTVMASSAGQNGSSLDGDLYLRGAGDPKLVLEHVWLMLRELRDRGIRTINGDLVLDHTLFEPAPYDPAAFDNEPYRPYNVGPDALLVNYKALTLRFMPDDAKREVRIAVEPQLAGFAIGSIAYVDGPCGDWRQRTAADFSHGDQIAFVGGYAGSCGEQTWNVAVLDHRQFTGGLFKSLWGELGGTLTGNVRDGVMPTDARVLVEHESTSLAEAVRDINKYSNNVMARELFLSTAAEVLKMPANPERAQRVVRGFYNGKGLTLTDLLLDNGSGLSRRERISAASMAQVLQAAWASPVMPEFVASLPLVGFDGTMRRRLNLQSVAGQAHVKTGTLADVRAAAGYVLAASGKSYVVVVFVNHPNAGGAQAAQDALLQWVYDRG